MFWEGELQDGTAFELELEYGTVILTFPEKREKIVIGHTSDFPDVIDVVTIFNNWVQNRLDRDE